MAGRGGWGAVAYKPTILSEKINGFIMVIQWFSNITNVIRL